MTRQSYCSWDPPEQTSTALSSARLIKVVVMVCWRGRWPDNDTIDGMVSGFGYAHLGFVSDNLD
ncbi:MAG: hypothetical protein Q9213_004508 [Squamulea squamosa]